MTMTTTSREELLRLAEFRGQLGMTRAMETAALTWIDAVEAYVVTLPEGATFIGTDVVDAIEKAGYDTDDLRALGPVMKRLAGRGLIKKTGRWLPSHMSHGTAKPEWIRTEVTR